MLAKLLIWILAGKEFEIFFVAQKKLIQHFRHRLIAYYCFV